MNIPKIKTVLIKSIIEDIQILHLSDLHINQKTSEESIIKLVDICNKSKADIVVITGDIIDYNMKKIEHKVSILNNINKQCFYISGNHDLYYGLSKLKNVLKKLVYLDNDYKVLNINNQTIAIAGLSDRFSKYFKIQREEKKVVNFLKKYKNSILIAHQPKDYSFALKANAKLFLCGHTHGGQIYPFHYIVKLFQPFLQGVFYKYQTAIFVNKGLGNWGFNFRYKADNEICLLKLTAKEVK